MKDFKGRAWFMPQSVIIIGTYDADGTPNVMNAAWSGQWDQDEIMISMGNHQTTVNLNGDIVSPQLRRLLCRRGQCRGEHGSEQ